MSIGSSQIECIFPLTSHTIPPQYKLFLGRCRGLLSLGPKHGLIGMLGENQTSAEALMTLCISPAVRPEQLQNPYHQVTDLQCFQLHWPIPKSVPSSLPPLFLVQPHGLFFPGTTHPTITNYRKRLQSSRGVSAHKSASVLVCGCMEPRGQPWASHITYH